MQVYQMQVCNYSEYEAQQRWISKTKKFNTSSLQHDEVNRYSQKKYAHWPADANKIWTLFRLTLNLLNACSSSEDFCAIYNILYRILQLTHL